MGRYLLPKKIFFCAMMLVTAYVFFHDKLHLPAPDIFQLHGKSTATQSVKQIKDEKSHLVPPTSIPPSRRVRFVNHSWHGYPLPLITCQPKGRLGNIMGEYATLWGLRRIYNVTALVSQGMKKSLKMFPALTLPSLEVRSQMTGSREEWRKVGRSGGSLYNFSLIEAASAGLLGPHLFQIQNSPFEMHLFSQFQDDLRREFAFSKQIQDQVNGFLREVERKRRGGSASEAELTFVGFHVRRGDYGPHVKKLFQGKLPGVEFFESAMTYFRKKFADDVAFIAASDDPRFIKATLSHHPDVFFAPGRPPELDLAALASCNHSIITLGSFGFWSGFLAGGEVVYPDTRFRRRYRFARMMYEAAHLNTFTPLLV